MNTHPEPSTTDCDYEQLQSCTFEYLQSVVSGRDTFLINDSESIWLLDDNQCVQASVNGEITAGSAPIVLEEDRLTRLTATGDRFRSNDDVDGRDVVTVLDEELVAVLSAGGIDLYEEETLFEAPTEPKKNPFDGEVSCFVGGFHSIAVAAGTEVRWYFLGDEEKIFQISCGDPVLDIGFLNETVAVVTESNLLAYDTKTGDLQWTGEGADEVSDRSRNRLLVRDGSTVYAQTAAGRTRVEQSPSLIAESPTGYRRLRAVTKRGAEDVEDEASSMSVSKLQTNTGPSSADQSVVELILECRSEPWEVAVPEADLEVDSEATVEVRVTSFLENAQRVNLSVELVGGELLGGSEDTTAVLSPRETLASNVRVRPTAESLTLRVHVDGYQQSFELDASRRKPSLTLDVTDVGYNTDGPWADIEVYNDGNVTLPTAQVSVDGETIAELDEVQPDERQTRTVSLPVEAKQLITVEAEAAESTENVRATATTRVPALPLSPTVEFRDDVDDTPTIDIRIANGSEAIAEETLRFTGPFGTVSQQLDFEPGETAHILIPLLDVPVGSFEVTVDGSVCPTTVTRFDGRPVVSVDRTVKQWLGLPDVDRTDEAGASISPGELYQEELTVTNQTDEALETIRIVTDGAQTESITSLQSGETATLRQRHAAYEDHLPSREVVVDGQRVAVPEVAVSDRRPDVIVRANLERQADRGTLNLRIENHSELTCAIQGVGIDGYTYFDASVFSEPRTVAPDDTLQLAKEISDLPSDSLGIGETAAIILEYSFEDWRMIHQTTATLARIVPSSLGDVLEIEMEGNDRNGALSVRLRNSHTHRLTDVICKHQYDRDSGQMQSERITDSLDPGHEKRFELKNIAPLSIVQGQVETKLLIKASLEQGGAYSTGFRVHARKTISGVAFEIGATVNQPSEPFESRDHVHDSSVIHLPDR